MSQHHQLQKVLIFDLDDTLYQKDGVVKDDYSGIEKIRLYPGVYDFLRKTNCKKVLVSKGDPLIQYQKLSILGIKDSFDLVLVCSTDSEKKGCFKQAMANFSGSEYWVIGDRVDSEIRYGNELGLKTVLLKKGKYAHLIPKDNLEVPKFEISDFVQLEYLLSGIQAVVLAAGKGTRMNNGNDCQIPKVMFPLNGKPIISYCLDNLKKAGIEKIILVVGYQKEMVEEYLGKNYDYAVQEKQLGTGHAVMAAAEKINPNFAGVIVCCGDCPLFKAETIKNLREVFIKENPAVALLSVIVKDPIFWAYGRVVRDENQNVVSIIEQKDCSPEELQIKECNTGFYIFDTKWLLENLSKIKTENSQKEYYLTDMIKIAQNQGKKVVAIPVSEESEALGINTPEQLRQAEEALRNIY